MTKTIALALVAASSLFAVVGCGGNGGEPEEGVQVDVAQGEVDTNYVARVTYKDLRDANANCVGTTCRLGGTVWDCKGGGYCSPAR